MNKIVYVLAGLAMLASVGCASIIKGTDQTLTFNSNPEGAQVLIDGVIRGETPLSIKLPKNRSETVMVKKAGFKTETRQIGKRFDGVAIINIFWDLSTTDFITGAVYEYEPNSYFFELSKSDN